jgi:hypothetical protein
MRKNAENISARPTIPDTASICTGCTRNISEAAIAGKQYLSSSSEVAFLNIVLNNRNTRIAFNE